MDKTHQKRILDEVRQERERQDQRWGGAQHDDKLWPWQWSQLRAKQEELMYLAVADARDDCATEVRKRLIKVIALCWAQVEALDREIAQTNKMHEVELRLKQETEKTLEKLEASLMDRPKTGI